MEPNNDENEKLEINILKIKKQLKININNDLSVVDGVFPIVTPDVDAGDIPNSKAIVNIWDIFWIFISILTHIADMITDLNLVSHYLINKQYGYFTWTCIFLFIPSLINIFISIQMYKQDDEVNPQNLKKPTLANKLINNCALWPIILVTQMAPVLRYLDTIRFAIKSYRARKNGDQMNQKKYYLKMLKEEQDIALLRILECFLEAAPHQILQLTIIIMDYQAITKTDLSTVHQWISVLFSLIGMGWAMSSYHRSIRKAQWDRENISHLGNWLQFFWHFFVTVSRIIAIVAVATISLVYVGIVTAIHWFIMTTWILIKPTGIMEFCRDRSKPPHVRPNICEKIKIYLFGAVFGVMYVFTYLKPKDGPTYYKHMFYYIVCGLENVAACLVWSLVEHPGNNSQWYYLMISVLCILPFLLGVIIMIIYYQFFHPNGKRYTANFVPQIANNVNHSV